MLEFTMEDSNQIEHVMNMLLCNLPQEAESDMILSAEAVSDIRFPEEKSTAEKSANVEKYTRGHFVKGIE
jgi:hypothetical protein